MRHIQGRKMLNSLLWLSFCMSFFMIQGCKSNGSEQNHQTFELNILHINDSHSHLDESTIQLQLKTAEDTREPIQVNYGGFSRVAALFKQLSVQLPNTLKIHAGDALVGDLYFKIGRGEAEAKMMNSICFDSFTLGNHEFDNGDTTLLKFLNDLEQSSACPTKTAVLSSNVVFGEGSALYQSNRVQPYTVIEKQGQKIGLIGVTTAFKTKHSSRPDTNTEFLDELASVQAAIDVLKAQGINKIVLQSHIGYQEDLNLIRQLDGVDIVIGGDSHSLLANENLSNYGFSPQGPYPTIAQDKNGRRVCVAQAAQYAYVVGQLNIEFDDQGHVLKCGGRPHILLGDRFQRVGNTPVLSAEELDFIHQDIQQSGSLSIVQPDAEADAILAPYRSAKILFGQQNVAVATTNFCLRRVPGTWRDINRSALGDVCNQNSFTHQHGGDIQQLVAEAYLKQGQRYFQANISLINGGGVREDIAQGDINVDKVYRILAFDNTLVQLNMYGHELKAMLEDAMQAVLNGQTGSYPYTAGMTWQVDLNQPLGQRVSHIQIRDAQNQLQTLDLNRMYKLITINFLADGQGSYHTLSTIRGDRRIDVGLDYTEAFLQYLEDLPLNNGTRYLGPLDVTYYSTQGFTDAAP
ncbi:bifunctional metallophosphatase/5'-nucleotidase [Acinetobacter sp. 194]|nr:bifunctional metallophosphatase/5'-nucleotidase [Acinetobacter shaoyimingii]